VALLDTQSLRQAGVLYISSFRAEILSLAPTHGYGTSKRLVQLDYALPHKVRVRSSSFPLRAGFAPDIHLWTCILWCMRTNIEIDDRVLHEAQELIGARTKREAVDVALRELVARHRRIGVLDLRGRVRWEGDLDESRSGRS
jgi:Arc/MetJ family transcription regulator